MSEAFNPSQFMEVLRSLRAAVPVEPDESLSAGLSKQQSMGLLHEIREAIGNLERLAEAVDPIRPPPKVLYPTDPKAAGELIAKLVEDLDPVSLEGVGEFYGSGVYAIYYGGDFAAYRAIRGSRCPIYVGKADPKFPEAPTPRAQGPQLSRRLAEHARSIGLAQNLDVTDFSCRFLVIQSGYQAAAEDHLINAYQPVWNKTCVGIGKHGDAARRERSAWDILHPGRPWASKQTSRSGQTPNVVRQEIERHFLRLCEDERDRWVGILDQEWARTCLRQ
ncbi:MAG: Eco29kI family restriction endonuclease [Phycisphaerae bacterium]|nr:Eco29kI family restriction endonuclease [Phycisphaerae bacterium]